MILAQKRIQGPRQSREKENKMVDKKCLRKSPEALNFIQINQALLW